MARYSIILPVRNGGEYLKECVHSILSQTFRDFNLIVLDNCSTDSTVAYLDSLNDRRIIIHKSDQSLTIEENWGRIKNVARNEFMTMIGHDDILLPHYLETMNELISRFPDATLYQTHYNYINAAGVIIRPCLPMSEKQYVHEFLSCQMERTIESTGTGYMMRSADYDDMGGIPVHYPNLIFADFSLWVNLMAKGYKATSFNNCFSYRVHNSISATTNGMAFQVAFGEYIKELHVLQETYPEIDKAMQRYGKDFLLFWCESLSHRLLKTPLELRSLKVADLIKLFKQYAGLVIPGQEFEPNTVKRIKLAEMLDSNSVSRSLFQWYRQKWPAR